MTLLLAIETSTAQCSVALGDGRMLLERSEHRPRGHHALVLPMIALLLTEAGIDRAAIDAIAFGRGPGSFTGLRIAAGIAQGLAFSLDRPVVPVSSLAALARAALDDAPPQALACVAMDAHMGGIFRACYRRLPEGIETLDPETLENADAFAPPPSGCRLAGDAWALYPGILPARAAAPVLVAPAAGHVLGHALGIPPSRWLPAAQAEPYYLRGVNAWKTHEQQRR